MVEDVWDEIRQKRGEMDKDNADAKDGNLNCWVLH
jgi:hypothetical protein